METELLYTLLYELPDGGKITVAMTTGAYPWLFVGEVAGPDALAAIRKAEEQPEPSPPFLRLVH